jgi:signal peptidase I
VFNDEADHDINEGSPSGSSVEALPSAFKTVRDWVVVLFVALVVALGIRTFVLQQFYISGPSMETTLYQPNRVLVNKFSYRLHDVRRGDVVVFDRVTSNGETVQHDDLIKRVVGLPEESVEIRDCIVFIDGKALDEPYLSADDVQQDDPVDRCRQPEMAKLVVPKKQIFVLGDNRPQSMDSRMFGPVDVSQVVGRAFVVIWPVNRWRWL